MGNNLNLHNGSTAPLILLVDDAVDLLDVWAILLKESGFRVLTASNGFAGLTLAKESLPNLVLTDYMMPGLDGLAMCRALRQDSRFATVPFIMWTAAMTVPSGAQIDQLLYKPVSVDALTSGIIDLLNRRGVAAI